MPKLLALSTGLLVLFTFAASALADVLIIADEFPAMQVVAKRLKADEGKESNLVAQSDLPQTLSGYEAVVVYIHGRLAEPAELACIKYANEGGRLILLHHSISSGKRQNREWFSFLGVTLAQGSVETGGYKWIEDVTADWVNLAGSHYIMTNQVAFTGSTPYLRNQRSQQERLPSFTLHETEVYLNHSLDGSRTVLMGLHYTDASGKTWMQDTAGWYRPAEKGWVFYFMPGHTAKDFENPAYGRIVLNAITAPIEKLR